LACAAVAAAVLWASLSRIGPLAAAIEERPLPAVRVAEVPHHLIAGAYRGDYQFTTDWFTYNIPVWEKIFAPYRGKPGVRYLEIGAFEGRSVVWLLENVLTDPTDRITAIDVFYGDYEPRYRSNVATFGRRVETIKAPSQIALRQLPLESFDIIYIDGSHATADVLEDAVLSWRLLKPAGMLIFDDYEWIGAFNTGRAGDAAADWPKAAIDSFCRCFAGKFDVVHNANQVVLRKR
jgi:hypothetical protein